MTLKQNISSLLARFNGPVSRIPVHIRFFIAVYLIGMVFFSLFRFILLLVEYEQMAEVPNHWWHLVRMFRMGFQYDSVVSCFFIFLPFLFLSVFSVGGKIRKWVNNFVLGMILLFYTVGFFICCADIPYFSYNYSRLTVAILNWTNTPGMMARMVFQEFSYYVYFFVFIITTAAFVYLVLKINRKVLLNGRNPVFSSSVKLKLYNAFLSLISFFIIFIGMRGTLAAPINEEHACFSSYAFPNMLGLNPVFTFSRSYLDKLSLMKDNEALSLVKKYFNIKANAFGSPVARKVEADSSFIKANVVIVIMESMAAEKMGRFGNKNDLTPNLDSLAKISLSFDHIYSAGKHTANGIYATLYAYPTLWNQRPTGSVNRTQYTGTPWVLKKHGYTNFFFTSQWSDYDNLSEFLPYNHFDSIISRICYPIREAVNVFGIPDHLLFKHALGTLDTLAMKHKPFLGVILTASDHGPYVIPDNIPFRPKQNNIELQIIEYADWSIGQFMNKVAQKPWFKNTIFVFTGDHGGIVGSNPYEIPLTFHHIPLIIYAPAILKFDSVINNLGGQIDIFPTLMGIMNASYVNNTLGVDLMKEKRPYAYFSSDYKLGCLDESYFMVLSKHKREVLYYDNGPQAGKVAPADNERTLRMKQYMSAMLQTSQWMIVNKKTGPEYCLEK